MKQKVAIMSWLVFNTTSLSSILADTKQVQAGPNRNKPQEPHTVTLEDNDTFKTVGSPHVSKEGKWIAYTTAGDGEYGIAQSAIVPCTGGPVSQYTYGYSFGWTNT